MTRPWRERLADLDLSEAAIEHAARQFGVVSTAYARRVGNPDLARAWWVPGRIEVLGKHTDYGGGRSLLTTVERGFHVLATPRRARATPRCGCRFVPTCRRDPGPGPTIRSR